MAQLQVRLFGAPTVILAEGREASLPLDKARGLLAYLTVGACQAHRREKLAGLRSWAQANRYAGPEHWESRRDWQ